MFFIVMLVLTTASVAVSAAYFSVYGLAHTFGGVFWSVVAMGASLEAAKLVAASYLYRFWTSTHVLLKSYLMFGILALMLLTSTGIFSFLSSGYQQDVLPLKQKTEQVALLEEEKTRLLDRKRQIDGIMAGSATVNSVQNDKGIDRSAVRALRETTRARESLVRQYKAEQADVTARLKQLDAELLVLKQDLIKVEAHIGPITYIAKAFNQPTDDATKWLIFLIIFAFDPMAVALTLAVNTALRVRQEEKDATRPAVDSGDEIADSLLWNPNGPTVAQENPVEDFISSQEPLPNDMATVLHDNLWDLYETDDTPTADLPPLEFDAPTQTETATDVVSDIPTTELVESTSPPQSDTGSPRRSRPYTNLMTNPADMSQAKIDELVNHYQYLDHKIQTGIPLGKDEQWEYDAVKSVLTKAGYSQYL